MSIIPDKKKGKLTGRYRVQLMVNYQLYRRRVDTLREATDLEREWKALKALGQTPPPPSPSSPTEPRRTAIEAVPAPQAVPVPVAPSMMLSEASEKAKGRIWKGRNEQNCLGQLALVLELMGDVALNDINSLWIMDLQAKLRDKRKVTDGTLNRYSAAISKFLKWAIDCEFRTVGELPKFQKHKEAEGRIRWYTPKEEAEMLGLLRERSRKLVRFAILTGGRKSELLAIEPNAVFPDRVILWGQQTTGAGTKSGKSRPILLTPEGHELATWLFVEGNAPTETMLRDDWAAMRSSKPEWEADAEFVFHGCRHTFAVRAVEAGVPIRTLQQWMGHETIEMTERYGKVSGKALENARDMMFAVAA